SQGLFPVLLLGVLGLSGHIGSAAPVKERDPADLSAGKVYGWQSEDGLAYHYRIPKTYDAEAGANLTFVLHGSNLSRTWGFANHDPDTFRPDDIVVCPDGTTPNGEGGFNFFGKGVDVERLHALHQQLQQLFKVNATFIYGHSQGSFFALLYAGAKPQEVQGVVAHASGVWGGTAQPETAHHQAVVFMHGTQDPIVPYGQSVGGYESMLKKGYPTVRLRSLEGWNHWPAEQNGPIPHTSQQLAWVEGMTSSDPKRQAAAFVTLSRAKDKQQHDFAGLYLVAARIAALPDASAGAKRASEKALSNVGALADKHLASLAKADPDAADDPGDGAWVGHLPMFLRAFAGVPAAETLREQWEDVLKEHQEGANQHLGAYYKALNAGDKAGAFSAGVEALKTSFLSLYCADRQFLGNLKKWASDARELGLDKGEVTEFKSLYKGYLKSLEDGKKAFESINRRASL
ncbi:MAG: hypothetical protein ACR2RV_05635, partial [Verrucomicrobiales bacterium]